MDNREKTNRTSKESNRLETSRPYLRSRKSAGSGRFSTRMIQIILFAAAFCLAAVPAAAVTPSLLNSAAVDGNTSNGNTLSNFTISGGSNRMLIVAVDDETKTHVTSVSLGSVAMTYVGGYVETDGLGNTTSLWVILEEDLPADGAYDIAVSGGNKPSVAAMLWSGLYQTVPAGDAVNGTGQAGGNQITTSVVAPQADSLVVATSGHGNLNGWATPPAGWTRQWYVEPSSAHHAGATKITAFAGQTSITETCGGGDFNRAAQFVAAFAPAIEPAPGCTGCRYRRPITIDPAKLGSSCGGDVANFPLLVTIEDNDQLKDETHDGHVENPSGYDIAFTDANGVPLYHEIERYDGADGTLVAWVRVPVLSESAETKIYMVYGDGTVSAPTARPAGVWDYNYRGVWHLNQSPNNSVGQILDSTANGNDGQSVSMETGERTPNGRIADALDFDGIDDQVLIGYPLGSAHEVTVSAWVYHQGIDSLVERYVSLGDQVVIRHNGSGQLHFYIKTDNDLRHLRVDNSLGIGTWYYVVGTWDGTTQRLYLDGLQKTSSTPGGTLATPGLGKISQDIKTMDGIIDEVRVSNTARDACWIETEYSNQSSPDAFHTIGAEEDLGAPTVTTYTITASAGLHGSIWPSGDVTVEEGKSATFFLVADQDYEVDSLVIDGDWLDYSTAQYRFDNVTADATIQVTFKPVVYGAPEEDDVLPPGCAQNISRDYSTGFDPDNLDIVNAAVDTERNVIWLNTGYSSINPDRIVIPFRQQVAVTFMYENGARKHSDFGWMLADEDPNTRSDPPHRLIYEDINDNDNNGVLDLADDNTTDRFVDRNGDGIVDARDNREILGTFDAGTEVVFFLKVDDGRYRNNMSNPVTGEKVTDFVDQNLQVYHYTKTDWNESRFTSQDTTDHPEWTCNRAWGDPFEKTYYLGRARSDVSGCHQEDGWMDAAGLTRAADLFGLNFAEDDTATLSLTWEERWPAVMVGAPAENLNAWVLGFEDLEGGGDMDNNDLIFIIERETGGTAGLKPASAISPPDVTEENNIRGVTIGVYDYMPGGACDGKTDISYWLSINAGDPDGETWVEVDGWDEVYQFTLVDGNKVVGNRVTNWEPGSPAYTYRTRRVDFAELGLTGRKLIWRADMKSRKEGCEPEIFDLSLDMTVGTPGSIGRASPTVLANVLYNGNMETPALNGTTRELRGHLKCTRIYDPTNPDQTASMELWDAGYVLKNQMEPSDRTIYIPNVTVHAVAAEQLAVGDGATTTFSGRLAHYPVLATTVEIGDGYTTFSDQHTDELDAGLNGSGWINRFTGEYRITFSAPPNPNQPITADYSYFTYNTGTLRNFMQGLDPAAPGYVSAAELGLDDSTVIPSGYEYDFNNDATFSAADADWLINWTRGYKDGASVEKDWILGPIDHSVAGVETPPTASPWFYGTSFPEDAPNTDNDRAGYRAFRDARVNRRSVVYVGARDGMLHAFDAGAFRWIDTDNDTAVDEKRGLFHWDDLSGSGVTYCDDITDCPDYGTGRELWAFIPANLLPRLKNNYLQGNEAAYVDASPALADVYVDNAWRTVLLAAEGNGGDTIYCLDVTDPTTPTFMWEFADPELFRSRSSPSVAQIGRIMYQNTTKWVAFFVSGRTLDDTLYPSIYVIDIADGSLVKKIALDAEPAGIGGVLSGQPTIVDSDGNGYVDRLYIGSDKGRLYKINIPDDPDSTKYRIGHCVINTDFTDRDGNSPPLAAQYQPIYGSPAVVSSNGLDQTGQMTYDIRIFFGTGDSPYYDQDINFDDTRYAFYAYRDTAAKGVCDDSLVSLDWFYELPKGHRIFTSAFAAAGNIYFGTSTGATEDPCDIDANSDAGFNPNAGRIYAFDLDNPDKAPSLERVVGNVVASPVAEDKHLYVQSISGDVDSFGDGHYNTAIRQGGIPRISINWWREVF